MKSIKTKLLLLIGVSLMVSSGILIHRTYTSVTSYVENLTSQQLSLALNFDLAIREYVAETIRPMMFKLVGNGEFIPETMSTSYVARRIFEKVNKKFPDYIIKFASGNPRNPVNLAGPEELEKISYFNSNPENTVWEGKIAISGKEYYAAFSAMRMTAPCLRCHGNPADAPVELIKRYGSDASFRRPLGEVVGMDTIAIPSEHVKKLLLKEKFENLGLLGIVMLLLCVSFIFVFKFTITDRLETITNHFLDAERQTGKDKIKHVEIKGRDEIAILAESFNRLSKKLNNSYINLTLEIERRKQIQKSLQASEKRLGTVLDHAPIIIWSIDQYGTIRFTKGRILDKFGLRSGQVIGRSVFDMFADNEQIVSNTRRVLSGETFSSVTVINGIVLENRYTPLKDKQGSVTGAIGVAMDVTSREKAEKELMESKEKYQKLFELESDALVLLEVKSGKMLDVNNAFLRLYGYSKEEILSMKVSDFSTSPEQTLKTIKNKETYIPLRYHKKKDGTVFPVEITSNYFKHTDQIVNIAAIRDITDRKTIEEKIEASLKDKEILLSEIHHRVKNNFEIISSLLYMTSMTTENREIRHLLLSSRNRIHSMAMIHSQLYQSDRFDRIDMAKHVGELAEHLQFLYDTEKKVTMVTNPSDVYLPLSQAMPCALVLNESITNALKYAFVHREHGKIEISINKSDDRTILIRVKDDGVGIPEGKDHKSSGGLGLKLIQHLVVGQLKGKVRFDINGGTDIVVEFDA